jgi:hypothetical protein
MKNFKLIGSYEDKDIKTVYENDLEIVTIPLLNNDGALNYGLEKIYQKLVSNGIIPKENALDILCLATLVYLADTRISRELHSQDSWTRGIELELPVCDPDVFSEAINVFEKMLGFLTGDKWSISFKKRKQLIITAQEKSIQSVKFDVVTLFSGGMDSLISTINHLEQKKKVMLISHAGEGFTKNSQTNILAVFKEKYPDLDPVYLDLWMVFDKDFIPNGGNENSTRSRSFLFIALGVFAITGVKNVNTLQVPENGLIAINIPLDDLRVGSHSTRTTHPFYMDSWNKILHILGIDISVINPYWDKTKGEMADECLNKEFLHTTMSKSASCSSPIKARWKKLPPQHCGYCVPCIIRRAAMNKAFGINGDTTIYTANSVKKLIREHANSDGVQLRSFQFTIKRIKENPSIASLLIYKTGPLKGTQDFINKLADVYRRGLLEVDYFTECCLKEEEKNEDV